MTATHMHTRLDRALLAQPASVPRCKRAAVKTLGAIAAPPKTKLNTEKSEKVRRCTPASENSTVISLVQCTGWQ